MAAPNIHISDTLCHRARTDPALFNALVLRAKGGPNSEHRITNAPYHWGWHDLLDKHDRVVLWGHAEAGKTTQIAIGRVLYELGRDPNCRVLFVSDAESKQSEKTVMLLRKYIEESTTLRRIFPHLRPGRPWRDDAFSVAGATGRDPSVAMVGAGGSIEGARQDIIIPDDLVTWRSTRTEYQRNQTISWLESAVLSRFERGGGSRTRLWFLANAWHREDAAHVMARRAGWVGRKFPIYYRDANGDMRLSWPARFTWQNIEAIRGDMSPSAFTRMMLCQPVSDDVRPWREEWIQRCLARGAGRRLRPRLEGLAPGQTVHTGMDLSVGKKNPTSHSSVRFTILVHDDGLRSREVIGLKAGKWVASEILSEVRYANEAYQSVVTLETVAAQDYIRQMGVGVDLRIRAFNTGANKHHPIYGVESIASEFEAGRWIIPCDESGAIDPEVRAWLDECRDYSPAAHTGDRLMSAWFAREDARLYDRGGVKTGFVSFGQEGAPNPYAAAFQSDPGALAEKAESTIMTQKEQARAVWDDLLS